MATVRTAKMKVSMSRKVSWCFTPSQPVRLYQGEIHLILYIYLIFNNVYVLKSVYIYTVLKPCLKGENRNITQDDQRQKVTMNKENNNNNEEC